MSIERLLRSVPELEHFSDAQRENLITSFGPAQLRRRTMQSSAYRAIAIGLVTGYSLDFFAPKMLTAAIVVATLLIVAPLAYVFLARQVRDEFRLLLQLMLAGVPLPACPRCGYDLTGAKNAQCPECGADVKWKRPEGTVIGDERETASAGVKHETPGRSDVLDLE